MRSMSAFETETLLAEMKSRKNLSPAERILMHKLKAAKASIFFLDLITCLLSL